MAIRSSWIILALVICSIRLNALRQKLDSILDVHRLTASTDVNVNPVENPVAFVEELLRRSRSEIAATAAKYELGDQLGEGGFGTVYKGYSRQTGKVYALKTSNLQQLQSMQEKNLIGTVRQEILNWKQVNHENIVKLEDVYATPGGIFLVTEYMPGGNLYGYMQKIFDAGNRLPEAEIRSFFFDTACAVQACHAQGLAHRDVTSNNILLGEAPYPKIPSAKLADFGNSLGGSDVGNSVHAGETVPGTPDHIAPEVLTKLRDDTAEPVDATKVDIWSLGIVLYTMYHQGKTPFEYAAEDPNPVRTVLLKIREYVGIDDQLSMQLPNPARDLIVKLLSRDPTERPDINSVLAHPYNAGKRCPVSRGAGTSASATVSQTSHRQILPRATSNVNPTSRLAPTTGSTVQRVVQRVPHQYVIPRAQIGGAVRVRRP